MQVRLELQNFSSLIIDLTVNLSSWLSVEQVSATSYISKGKKGSNLVAIRAAKSAKIFCSRYPMIKTELGSSRWIRLRDVSASKDMETYPSSVTIVVAWPISKTNSCSSSQANVTIGTLSLRSQNGTNGKNCLEFLLMLKVPLHVRLETRSTCSLSLFKPVLSKYCTTLMLPSPRKRCTGKILKCQKMYRF